MRVLIVTDTYPPDINGVAHKLPPLGTGLERRGHAVKVPTTVAGAGDGPRQMLHFLPLLRSGENGWLAPYKNTAAFRSHTRTAASAWQQGTLRRAARQSAFDLGWERMIEPFEQELDAQRNRLK
jgi:hypothetical protein